MTVVCVQTLTVPVTMEVLLMLVASTLPHKQGKTTCTNAICNW